MLRRWDDSQKYLSDNPHLVCEETANYLVIWCIDLEVEEVRKRDGTRPSRQLRAGIASSSPRWPFPPRGGFAFSARNRRIWGIVESWNQGIEEPDNR